MTGRARARAVAVTLVVSLAAVNGCHRSLAPAQRTQPAPATRATAAVTPGLTDQQWIDSVAHAWASQRSARAESSVVRPVAGPGARGLVLRPAVASSATTSATSYAEAAAPETAVATEDHAPLIVICAVGAMAFVIAVACARVAIGSA